MELKGSLCEFTSTDHYKLVGFLNNIKSKTALIHLHGMGSFFWKGDLVYEACNKAEIGCFLINNRGSVPLLKLKSSIDEKDKFWAGTGLEIFEDCIKDIDGAIDFLKQKGYEKFIICGHSSGSQKSLYYALNSKKQEEILGFVFLAPGDDFNLLRDKYVENFSEVFEKAKRRYDERIIFGIEGIGYFSPKRFYDLVKEDSIEGNLFNYKKELSHIKKVEKPILAVFGKDEEHALIPPKEMLDKIENNFTNKSSKTELISGDHSFRGGEEELKETLYNWIKKI